MIWFDEITACIISTKCNEKGFDSHINLAIHRRVKVEIMPTTRWKNAIIKKAFLSGLEPLSIFMAKTHQFATDVWQY